jgi:DNA/RNA-binding domain of Phe-tRNA-synthetase-like protein
MLTLSDSWRTAYRGASQGLLVMHNVLNPESHAGLEARKAELETDLRARFAGYDRAAFNTLPTIQPYSAYYAQFKKTYHVQLQLESIVLKGKAIPRVAALVEAMFMSELKSQLLTAGHDLDLLSQPLRLEIAGGSETYTMLNGKLETLKPNDIYMTDAEGVTSSIIYGPDKRTPITPATRNVLFTVYAPPGIEVAAVQRHLEDIQANVSLVSPEATTELLKVYTTSVP